MVVSAPHIGNIYIFIKALFERLGVNYVIAPPSTKRTLELGAKYSPEMACLPLKINLGNYIESIEEGADTVIITGGCGPCRFGYYCKIQEEILKDLGYSAKLLAIDPSLGITKLARTLHKLFGTFDIITLLVAITRAYKIMHSVDMLDKLCYKLRPRERIKGSVNNAMRELKQQVLAANGIGEIKKAVAQTRKKLLSTDLYKDTKPLKIAIVGDIYTIIEPFTNVNIEEMLGGLGVEADKSLYISKWIKEHIARKVNRKERHAFDSACYPYLKTPIGGHARESIGHSALYAQSGFDGIIQIYPFTCMPEIVASSILPAVSRDYHIPILTIIIDEITGDAGYKTRIEAFIDLLNQKREAKKSDTVICRN